MSLKYWDQAFLTATYLINLLPSKVINFDTQEERLLKEQPYYSSLRVFGRTCWANLRPYNSRKLSFRSICCAFLGYSSQQKGFKCLDISTSRIYISRDVVFDEQVFPFAQLHYNVGAQLWTEIVLLPSHLLNPGDVNCTASNITNTPDDIDSSDGLQEIENIEQSAEQPDDLMSTEHLGEQSHNDLLVPLHLDTDSKEDPPLAAGGTAPSAPLTTESSPHGGGNDDAATNDDAAPQLSPLHDDAPQLSPL
jgi:hypothetical protein